MLDSTEPEDEEDVLLVDFEVDEEVPATSSREIELLTARKGRKNRQGI